MSWWKFWSDEEDDAAPPDYYEEGVELARKEKYHEALTSFRLALRESPENVAAMEQMDFDLPLVIRLTGTNEEEGVKILEDAGFSASTSMDDVVKRAVEMVENKSAGKSA